MKYALATLLSVCLLACVEAHGEQPTAAKHTAPDARRSMQSLRTQLSRASEGLVVEHRADGLTKVHLQGRFASASVMAADGRAICVDSPAALDRVSGAER